MQVVYMYELHLQFVFSEEKKRTSNFIVEFALKVAKNTFVASPSTLRFLKLSKRECSSLTAGTAFARPRATAVKNNGRRS